MCDQLKISSYFIIIFLLLLSVSCKNSSYTSNPLTEENNKVIHQDFEDPKSPSPLPSDPNPGDDQNSPPITIASPPILFLQARGTYEEDEGQFRVQGHVEDGNGRPVFEAQVNISNQRSLERVQVQTDEEGFFETAIPVLIGDFVEAQAVHPDFAGPSNVVEFEVVKDFIFLMNSQISSIIDPGELLRMQNPTSFNIPFTDEIFSVVLSQDKSLAYFIYKDDGAIRVFDLRTDTFVDINHNGFIDENDKIEIGPNPYDISFSADGNYIFVAYDMGCDFRHRLGYCDEYSTFGGRKVRVLHSINYQIVDLNNDGLSDIRDDISFKTRFKKVVSDPELNRIFIFGTSERVKIFDLGQNRVVSNINIPSYSYSYNTRYCSTCNVRTVNVDFEPEVKDIVFWQNQVILSVTHVADVSYCGGSCHSDPDGLRRVLYFYDYESLEFSNIYDVSSGKMHIHDEILYIFSSRTPYYMTTYHDSGRWGSEIVAFDLLQREQLNSLYIPANSIVKDYIVDQENNAGLIFKFNNGAIKKVHFNQLNENFINQDESDINYDYDIGYGQFFQRYSGQENHLYSFANNGTVRKLNLNDEQNRSFIDSQESDYEFFNLSRQDKLLPLKDNKYLFYFDFEHRDAYLNILDLSKNQYLDINNDGISSEFDKIILSGFNDEDVTDIVFSENESLFYISYYRWGGWGYEVDTPGYFKVYSLKERQFLDLNKNGISDFYGDKVDLANHIRSFHSIPNSPYILMYGPKIYFLDKRIDDLADINHDGLSNEEDFLAFDQVNSFYLDDDADIVFSSDNSLAYISSNQNNVCEIHLIDLHEMRWFDRNQDGAINQGDTLPFCTLKMMMSPNGQQLYIIHKKYIWLNEGEEARVNLVFSIVDTLNYNYVDLNSDGISDEDDYILIAENVDEERLNYGVHTKVKMTLSPDHQFLYISSYLDGMILRFFDLLKYKIVDVNKDYRLDDSDFFQLPSITNPSNIQLSYQGDYIYLIDSGSFYIIDTWTYELKSFPVYEHDSNSIYQSFHINIPWEQYSNLN